MAQRTFYNPSNPAERHPKAYQRILELLYIDNPDEYRKRLKPIKLSFNCQEKEGFRELPGKEKHNYQGHQFTKQEKEKVEQYKQQR